MEFITQNRYWIEATGRVLMTAAAIGLFMDSFGAHLIENLFNWFLLGTVGIFVYVLPWIVQKIREG